MELCGLGSMGPSRFVSGQTGLGVVHTGLLSSHGTSRAHERCLGATWAGNQVGYREWQKEVWGLTRRRPRGEGG